MTLESRNSRFRYRIFTMVVLLALINYIDRGAMSYAAAHITGEYGLDRGDWGAVLGYFGYGYMVGALFGGMLADRYGPRKVWIVAGVTWSIFEIATAWAGDFGLAFLGGSALAGFATIRILFGAAEGRRIPSSTRPSPTGPRRANAASWSASACSARRWARC
ncbi:MFS transporter [Achromobacter xylosoxidans]